MIFGEEFLNGRDFENENLTWLLGGRPFISDASSYDVIGNITYLLVLSTFVLLTLIIDKPLAVRLRFSLNIHKHS